MTKAMLFLMMILTFNVYSQCGYYLEYQYDKFNDITNIFNKQEIVITNDGHSGLMVTVLKHDKVISIMFSPEGLGCIDENNSIILLFSNGDRMILHNMIEFNCEPSSVVFFEIKDPSDNKLLRLLSENIITDIRTHGINDYLDVHLETTDAINIKNTISCMLK